MLRNTTPMIFPSNIEESKRFYQDVLGFVIAGEDDGFVELRSSTLSLWLHDLSSIDDEEYRDEIEANQRGVGVNLCFEVDDVDKYYERLVENEGAPVEQEPEEKPWGIRRFTVRDPDGYHLQLYAYE